MQTIGRWVIISVCLCSLFSITAFAGNLQDSRLIPENKVTIVRDGRPAGEFTQEAPCPEDTFLSCQGACGIKLTGLTLMAADGSVFAIKDGANGRYLKVQKGRLYFGIAELQRPYVFLTPKGAVSADRMLVKASTEPGMVKGYIQVSEEASEIGVMDGGSLHMLTRDRDKLLPPGKKLILAQANMGQGAGTSGGSAPSVSGAMTAGQIVGLTIAASASTGVAWGLAELLDDDDDHHASPSRPNE